MILMSSRFPPVRCMPEVVFPIRGVVMRGCHRDPGIGRDRGEVTKREQSALIIIFQTGAAGSESPCLIRDIFGVDPPVKTFSALHFFKIL